MARRQARTGRCSLALLACLLLAGAAAPALGQGPAPTTQPAPAQAPAATAPAAAAAAASSGVQQPAAAPTVTTAVPAQQAAAIPSQPAAATVAPAQPAAAPSAAAQPAAAAPTTPAQPAAATTAAPAQPAAAQPAAAPASAPAPAAADAPSSDIDPNGACKESIKTACDGVELGDGRVADCLRKLQEEEAADGSKDGTSVGLPDACDEEVMQFKIKRAKSLSANMALAKVCSADANKLCDTTWFAGFSNGTVISCLRGAKDKLTPACKREVFKVQLDAAYDYRADEALATACKADATTHCKDVKPGGGRIQDCLRAARANVSWECDVELTRKASEDADDIRLSVRLFKACLPDKRQFCADVDPGFARAKNCLEQHRQQLSAPCRREFDGLIERRVRDFRLDSRLRGACEGVIYSQCSFAGDADDLEADDTSVINCLQDLGDEVEDEACKAQIHKYDELAAQDIRFDVPLADACFKDRTTLCANVPPGSARVIRCLANQRDKLSYVCKAKLLDEEVRFSENIDFQFPMKQACLKEIDRFCKDVPHGNARVIRCLQNAKAEQDYSAACKAEVERYERESARDYRLNARLAKACRGDIDGACKAVCSVDDGELCGGKVLSCLTENKAQLKAGECKKEVAFLEKMEVQDFRTDMALAEACRADVEALCTGVQPGDGRVHKCLRENSAALSPSCKREEMRIEEKEADNVSLNVGLMRGCKGERTLFCNNVAAGSARVFRCLAEHTAQADFGPTCKGLIMAKLQRREVNWRLDPPLRKACKANVDSICAAEDSQRSEDGAVKKCLVANEAQLDAGCRRELGRSVHMSFFVWRPAGLVTAPCDADVARLCLSKAKAMGEAPGAVAACLAEIVEGMAPANVTHARRHLLGAPEAATPASGDAGSGARAPPQLSAACHALALLAEPPHVDAGLDMQRVAYAWLSSSMGQLESATGLPVRLVDRSRQGQVTAVSLTGWTALAGMAALVLVMLAGSTYAVRQYLGRPADGYSLVTKAVPAGQL